MASLCIVTCLVFYACLGLQMERKPGVRQRLQLTTRDRSEVDKVIDHVDEHAKKKFKDGKYSAADVHSLVADVPGSRLAQRPGATDVNICKNMSRNLIRKMTKSARYPEPYEIDCTFWDNELQCKYTDRLHMLLPYETFDSLCEDGVSKFTDLPPHSNVSNMRAAWGARVLEPGADVSGFVATGIWGDSGPFTSNDCLFILLYSFLAPTTFKRVWITAFQKSIICQCGCFGRCTFDCIWSAVSWAYVHWMSGEYPWIRHDNVPFAQSKRVGDKRRWRDAKSRRRMRAKGCCNQKRGDWAWLKQCLNLRSWSGEGKLLKMCFRCGAQIGGDCPMTDVSMGAKWRSTRIADYLKLERTLGTYVSGMWAIPGMVLMQIVLDIMHVSDLGILQYFLGNVVFEMWRKLGGKFSSPKAALGLLVIFIKMGAKHLKLAKPLNKLTVGMFKPEKKEPRLKLKAAKTRHMLKILHWICTEIYPPENDHEEMRLHCLIEMHQFHLLLDAWEPGFEGLAQKHGRRHVALYLDLAREGLKTKEQLNLNWFPYKFYPKHHLFIHLVEEDTANWGNMKEHWGYLDENEMGISTRIASKQHCSFVHRSLVEKYRL